MICLMITQYERDEIMYIAEEVMALSFICGIPSPFVYHAYARYLV